MGPGMQNKALKTFNKIKKPFNKKILFKDSPLHVYRQEKTVFQRWLLPVFIFLISSF